MANITLVLMLCIIVEGFVEYCKSLMALFVQHDKKPFVLQLGALAVAVILALLTGADFFTGLGITFAYPMIGSVFTGIFLSRGSNYISDFIGKLSKTVSVTK